jgi:hypothetical protein
MSDQLTLFAGDTPASHSPQPGSAQARTMTATSGLNLVGSWTNSGPLGSLERMLLGTSAWASMTCLLTWKAKDTPAGRLLFQLVPSAHRIAETEHGLWPTPMAGDTIPRTNESYIKRRETMGLPITLSMKVARSELWPTPTASMFKGSSPAALTRKTGASRENDRLDHKMQATEGSGSLNPPWVEALMGFPAGWTDLGNEE